MGQTAEKLRPFLRPGAVVANAGKGLKVQRWMRGYMCYVLPVLVAVILVLGLIRH